MGEYAKRRSDGAEVKIGTCEDMYYLRYDDRHKVEPLPGSLDPAECTNELRFRIPFPDEDGLQPGEYGEYNRSVPLVTNSTVLPRFYTDESLMSQVGLIQLHHQDSGLLINVPCYHGMKLPDLGKDCKAFWNGKGYAFVLSSIRPIGAVDNKGEYVVLPVIRCRFCNDAWRSDWDTIWEYLPVDMRIVLRQYKEMTNLAEVMQ